jgi:hypothetical protein
MSDAETPSGYDGFTLERVHIDSIKVGDIVEFGGQLRTVSGPDLKHDRFIGPTLWGDSYRCGCLPVVRAVPIQHYRGARVDSAGRAQ